MQVLLSVSDMETAQEMVKVHSFRPAKIRDTEVKMTHIKQNIGLSTPVRFNVPAEFTCKLKSYISSTSKIECFSVISVLFW